MRKNKAKFVTLGSMVVLVVAAALMLAIQTNDIQARQQSVYTGDGHHEISLDKAVQYIDNFRNHPTAPDIKGGFFGRSIFDKILAQEGCTGIRYYYARKSDSTATIVLVGVDSTGNDLLQGTIGEEIQPCPPFCPSPNALNR